MRTELLESEVDGVRIDFDVHGAGLGFTVQHDGAAGRVELAAPHGHATEVVRLEARIGVLGVHVVGDRRGESGGGNRARKGAKSQANQCLHGKYPRGRRWPGRSATLAHRSSELLHKRNYGVAARCYVSSRR